MIDIDPDTYKRLKNEFLKTNFKCYSKEYLDSAEGQNELEEHLVRRYLHAMNYTIPWVRGCFELDGKTILEIGCGSGSISAAFAQFTKHVYGYDIHETSIEAAKARVNVLNINNADFILAEPANIIVDIKNKFIHEKIDIVLLHALLEHQTIDERIETLKTAWEIVDDNGIIIVSESPNRFSFYDDHSSLLHFFHMIPDELALLYYQKSPRSGFKDSLSAGLTISQEDALERLARFGRGVSYHEFEIALGDIGDNVILDGYEPEILQLRGGLREEEIFLFKYITKNNLHIPPAFAKRYLDIVFSKRKISSQAKSERAARLESIMKTAIDEELFELQKKLLHHESTLSWRITVPLRWIKFRLKKLQQRFVQSNKSLPQTRFPQHLAKETESKSSTVTLSEHCNFMDISAPMPTCPVCGSTSLQVLRKLVGVRSKKSFDLFECKGCGSLYNPSGYKEDDTALAYDLIWHIKGLDQSTSLSRDVLKQMKNMHKRGKEILDVGAGIGSLMRVAPEFGLSASGVEPNPYAVLYGKRVFSLDIVCGYFDNSLYSKKFDFITIISVLEHLSDPRTLFEKAKSCLEKKGVIFVSVPLYDPVAHHKFLMNPQLDGSIFCDSDVHILHFTDESFEYFARQNHATSIKKTCGGYLIKFD